MHRDYIAYFTWLGDELIAVPDFPAWVCDILRSFASTMKMR